MAHILSNVTLFDSHTAAAPLAMDAAVETFYTVKNKSDIPVIGRANKGASGVTKGAWTRIAPFSEAMLQHDDGAAITQLEFYIHSRPRYGTRAASAQIEITTR